MFRLSELFSFSSNAAFHAPHADTPDDELELSPEEVKRAEMEKKGHRYYSVPGYENLPNARSRNGL
jgi:hypothetical protein